MEKADFVITIYRKLVLTAFFPSSRKYSREMPDTRTTDLTSLDPVFLLYIVTAVVILPRCNMCAVLRSKRIISVPSGIFTAIL